MTPRQFGGWTCTVIGGSVTGLLLVSGFADGSFDWMTDMSRLPKYAIVGPLALIGGLFVLRDVYGQQEPGSDRPNKH